MGGVKRKIAMKLIEKKDSRAVAFSKRTKGLYSKASELCLLSDAQIAIIATPVSSNSNASFYTFGHSSVDSVVAAFLANQHPREDHLGFWWEDESLARSENPEELRGAIDSMSTMLNSLKQVRFDAVQNRRDHEDVKKKGVLHGIHQNQTLDFPSSSTSLCIQDDVTVNFDGFNKNTEEQTLAVCDNSNNNGLLGNLDDYSEELDLDQIFDYLTTSDALSVNLEMDDVSTVTTSQTPFSMVLKKGVLHGTHQNQTLDFPSSSTSLCIQNPFSVSEAVQGKELVVHKDLDEDVLHLSDLDEDQILGISENNNNYSNNVGCNEELDFDHIIDFDFETKSEGLSMDLDQILIDFETSSDFFDEFTSITAI